MLKGLGVPRWVGDRNDNMTPTLHPPSDVRRPGLQAWRTSTDPSSRWGKATAKVSLKDILQKSSLHARDLRCGVRYAH